MKNALKRLRQIRDMYKPFHGAFKLLLFLILLLQLVSLVSPYFYGKLIDGFIKEKPVEIMLIYVGIVFVVVCTRSLLETAVAETNIKRLSYDLEDHIAGSTLGNVLKLSVGQITNQNSGFKQDVIKKGEAAITETVSTLVFDLAPALARLAATITALYFLNWIIATIALVSIVGFITCSVRINQEMLPRLKKHHKVDSKLGTAYWEIIKHLRLVMVSSQERRAIDEYSSEYKAFGIEGKSIWIRYVRRVTLMREPIAILGQLSILLLCIHFTMTDRITPGTVVVILSWSANAFTSLNMIGTMQRRISRYLVQIGRYFDLMELPPAITIVSNPIRLEKPQGSIEFRSVSFQYPEFKKGKDGDEDEENFDDLKDRAKLALEFLENRTEENILVVTHGMFLRVMAAYVIFGHGLTALECRRFLAILLTENTGVTVFTYDREDVERPWRLSTWNDHAHLGE